MAIISRADLFNYLKCSALAVKWQNILDSYWHKNDTIPASAIEIDVIEVIIQNAYVLTASKTDLTKFGSILMMGLIGIIIAMVVNMFLQSAMMDYVISGIGVLIFTGLTAYDVQKLKRIGAGVEYGTDETNKLSIMGALSLYLDFINLFLFLLRFMGDRK